MNTLQLGVEFLCKDTPEKALVAENPIKEGVNAGILGIPPAVISMRVSNDCRCEKKTYGSVKKKRSQQIHPTSWRNARRGTLHRRQEEGEENEI